MVIVAGIITVRAPSMSTELFAFFENPALVWVTGSMMLLGGLLIIAHHQYWSSLAAILISLFGWSVALRGLALLIAPQLYAKTGTAALNIMPLVQIGFGVLALIGDFKANLSRLDSQAGPLRPPGPCRRRDPERPLKGCALDTPFRPG